jgi:hypothetical protein
MSVLRFFQRIPVPEAGSSSTVPECQISTTTTSMLEAPPLADSSSVALADSSFVENRSQKRKKRDSSSFMKLVFDTTGLQLAEAPKKNKRSYSSCTHKPCVAVIQNQLDRWVQHRKVCKGKQALLNKEAQTMAIACTAGGEKHRRRTCDMLTIAYTLYKRKMSFATAPAIKEVCTHVVDLN